MKIQDIENIIVVAVLVVLGALLIITLKLFWGFYV